MYYNVLKCTEDVEIQQKSFRGGAVVWRVSPVEHEEIIRGREILTWEDRPRSTVDLGTKN